MLRLFFYGLVLLPIVLLAGSINYEHDSSPEETIESYSQKWNEIVNNDSLMQETQKEQFLKIIDSLFYLERLGPQILQKTWVKLDSYAQNQLVEALKSSILQKICDSSLMKVIDGKIALTFKNKEIKEYFAMLNCDFVRNNHKISIEIYMLRSPKGSWKISNLKIGNISILHYYYSVCDDILKKYSFPYLVSELGEYHFVALEDFEGSPLGELPVGWTWKKQDNDKNKPYRIETENGNKYLEATDDGESVILGKEIKWDLKKYPYISFRWRGHRIPEGGDERFHERVDSAAGIYIIYKKKFGLIPESVKYVWSSKHPVGSAMRRSGIGRPWMVVAESGKDHLGEWRTYVFNLFEAYQKTFGGNSPDVAIGIGILSDANSTKSHAHADYDDIRALKKANADSGVLNILKAE